jgi:quercetin dioxygenase-like cupin family protein
MNPFGDACDWDGTAFPDLIRNLPEVDVPLEGVRGWLLQGEKRQVVFFDILPGCEVPPHSHCAQWGIMVEGEMELTIGGEKRLIGKGDWYYIPEGVEHSAQFPSRVNVIDFFDSTDRYKARG